MLVETHHGSRPRALRSRQGFTLIEILTALVIMAIIAALAIPRLNLDGYKVSSAVRGVSAGLTYAQRLAVSLQSDVRVSFDSTQRRLRVHEDVDNDGVIDPGEEPQHAMRRELLEETGYQFDSIEEIGTVSPNPATSTNYMHMFLATGGKKVAEQKLDATEDVEVLIHSIDEVKQMLKANKIIQSLHVTTAFYALEKLGLLNY